MTESNKFLLKSFIEKNWRNFQSYLEENGEDEDKSEEILKQLEE